MSVEKGNVGDVVAGVVVVCASNLLAHGSDSKVGHWARHEDSEGGKMKVESAASTTRGS
jgi:hypothetical protein